MAGLRNGGRADGVDAELLSQFAPLLGLGHGVESTKPQRGNVQVCAIAVAFDHRGVKLREP